MSSIIIVVALAVMSPVSAGAEDAQKPCCFTNPSFAGTCQVIPDEETTCDDVLAYLNNPNSFGRVYCLKTKVRGGWKKIECDGEQARSCTGADDAQVQEVAAALP